MSNYCTYMLRKTLLSGTFFGGLGVWARESDCSVGISSSLVVVTSLSMGFAVKLGQARVRCGRAEC